MDLVGGYYDAGNNGKIHGRRVLQCKDSHTLGHRLPSHPGTIYVQLPSLHQRWEGFLGDKANGQKPLFTIQKSLILPTKNCVQVLMNCGLFSKPCTYYKIEGSFSQRCCTIYANARQIPITHVGFFYISFVIQVFDFADKHRGPYSNSLKSAIYPFYCSYSGYK
ncbi:hypothetical protein KI387_016794, partial [Taxus chinensis]